MIELLIVIIRVFDISNYVFVIYADVRPVKAEVLKARGRAFQLTAEEVPAAPDVVAGTYFLIYLFFDIYCAYSVLYLGTFLMSSIPSLVLFDSGASRSFCL